MPKNKAKGRRGGGGQARGAEKLEQRQMRNAIASQTPAVQDIVSGVHFDDRVNVALFRDQWYACGHNIFRWPRIRKISRDGVAELCLGRLGNIDDVSHAMVKIPDEIGDLESSLTKLDLNGCSSIKSLPDSIGELGGLTELILNDCASLTALPDDIGLLNTLTHLDLSGCSSLKELPHSIYALKSLTRLNLSGCSGLVRPFLMIGGAKALAELDASNCSSITGLYYALRELSSLTKLDLSGSGLVTITPHSMKRMLPTGLRILDLSGCASLLALPVEIDTVDGLSVIGADDVPRYDNNAWVWTRLAMRRCDECFRQFDLDAPRLRVCGGCRMDCYCGVDCQRAHWEDHRPVCRRIRKETRRRCVVCGRGRFLQMPPFPTCHCGERRYCGEECQAEDWAAGHARKCKSGYLYLDGS